jgi:hypothetical protein
MKFGVPLRRIAAGLALAIGTGVGTANAAAILYFKDLSVGTDRMASALTAVSGTHTVTTAASLAAFTTSLSGGGFDLAIFFQQNSSGAAYEAAWAAIDAHIAGGGAAIGADWTRTATHADGFDTGFTGNVNDPAVTVTAASLLPGIANPVSLTNPGWGVFSTGLTPGPCAATFGDGECAIVFGNGGRTIFNGFLNDTFADGAEGTQLYINEITALLAVPEPGTLALVALALLGFGAAGGVRRPR